jgi:hypothetical protein
MRSFNLQSLSALILGMAVASAVAADVTLKGDAKLSGEITGIASDGTITLLSPNSEKALILSADQLQRVVFGNTEKNFDLPEQRIELSNGDLLPVRVTSMEADLIRDTAPSVGSLRSSDLHSPPGPIIADFAATSLDT